MCPESPTATKCRDRPEAPWVGALIGDWFSLASETTGSSGLAERYAAALFELADDRHALDAVAGDLRELRAMVTGSPDLVRLLRSPVLSREAQGKAVEALAASAGLSELTRNFLGVVAANRRLFAVPDMIEAYLKKLADRRGEVTAQVTVAQPLNEARQQLQTLIEEMRRLDPSRFPGNPALVEQMRQQLVSGVDALELQLRRQIEENHGSTIRNTDPARVPPGYQESVAEYYRKLSSGH